MSIHHCGANDYINHPEYRATIISMFNILGFQIGSFSINGCIFIERIRSNIHNFEFTECMRHLKRHIVYFVPSRALKKSKPQYYSPKDTYSYLFLQFIFKIRN